MLGPVEKAFFMHTAIGASEMSGCKIHQGAVLVRDRQLLSYGFNRKVVKDGPWEMSAIYDSIFGSRKELLVGTTLFSTYFPSADDLKLMVAVGVTSVHFMGTPSDADAIRLINALHTESVPLEMVQLEK